MGDLKDLVWRIWDENWEPNGPILIAITDLVEWLEDPDNPNGSVDAARELKRLTGEKGE